MLWKYIFIISQLNRTCTIFKISAFSVPFLNKFVISAFLITIMLFYFNALFNALFNSLEKCNWGENILNNMIKEKANLSRTTQSSEALRENIHSI